MRISRFDHWSEFSYGYDLIEVDEGKK